MNENLVTIKTAIVAAGTALGAFLGWKGVMLISWVIVMALDYVTGTMAACKDHAWSSTTAREGLWHKGGMISVVIVAAIADWIMVLIAQYIPIGIQWPGIILPMVLAWYIITELGSILENAVKMGANVPGWLVKLLKASANIVATAGNQTAMDEPEQTHDTETE
ncbi:MAG: holin family protein [Faecousia sp.]